MRVVCPFVDLHPETRAFLDGCGYPVEYEYVGGDQLDYSALIAQLWHAKRSFVICEQDIVPLSHYVPGEVIADGIAFVGTSTNVLDAMVFCPEPYCAAMYDWGTNRGPAMGLTKFSSGFIRTYPFAAWQLQGVSWRQMDWVLIRKCLAADLGQFPHVHLPAIRHLNPEKSPLSIHAEESDEWHLNALGFVLEEGGLTARYQGGPFGDVKGFVS